MVEPVQERLEYFLPPILPRNQIRRSAASWIKIWAKVSYFFKIVFKVAYFKTILMPDLVLFQDLANPITRIYFFSSLALASCAS